MFNFDKLQKAREATICESSTRRSFGKRLLASGIALGLTPLAFPTIAMTAGNPNDGIKAPENKLQAAIQEQLRAYLGGELHSGNALDKARHDDDFHTYLDLRLM